MIQWALSFKNCKILENNKLDPMSECLQFRYPQCSESRGRVVKADESKLRGPGFIPARVDNFFFVCSILLVGEPQKQLGTATNYYVMINAPMTCLTMKRPPMSDGQT